MKKLTLTLTVMAVSLLLVSGLALAQHSHDHVGHQSDSLKSGTSQGMMMPMHEKMMGKGMMKGGMMEKGDMKCDMMGKGMMQGGMKGHGMMQGQQGHQMMGMSDPVIQSLHAAGYSGFLLKSADQLELTEKQVNDLKSLKADFQKFAVQKNADIKVAKIELNELIDAANPDFGKIKSKISQLGSLNQDLRFQFLTTVQNSRKLLTADQLKKLPELAQSCCMGMMGKGMMK